MRLITQVKMGVIFYYLINTFLGSVGVVDGMERGVGKGELRKGLV